MPLLFLHLVQENIAEVSEPISIFDVNLIQAKKARIFNIILWSPQKNVYHFQVHTYNQELTIIFSNIGMLFNWLY